MRDVIQDYVATLRRELSFDAALARRFSCEIEDHLREIAEADPAWPSPDASRRAIARLGPSRDIAARFAADAVERQTKRTWLALLITVLATLVAMRLRAGWVEDGALFALAPLIDRYAFLASVGVAGVGWFVSRRSLAPHLLCLLGLCASIIAGLVRAELFLRDAPLVVLLPAMGETALLFLLSCQVVLLGHGRWRTATLRRLV